MAPAVTCDFQDLPLPWGFLISHGTTFQPITTRKFRPSRRGENFLQPPPLDPQPRVTGHPSNCFMVAAEIWWAASLHPAEPSTQISALSEREWVRGADDGSTQPPNATQCGPGGANWRWSCGPTNAAYTTFSYVHRIWASSWHHFLWYPLSLPDYRSGRPAISRSVECRLRTSAMPRPCGRQSSKFALWLPYPPGACLPTRSSNFHLELSLPGACERVPAFWCFSTPRREFDRRWFQLWSGLLESWSGSRVSAEFADSCGVQPEFPELR